LSKLRRFRLSTPPPKYRPKLPVRGGAALTCDWAEIGEAEMAMRHDGTKAPIYRVQNAAWSGCIAKGIERSRASALDARCGPRMPTNISAISDSVIAAGGGVNRMQHWSERRGGVRLPFGSRSHRKISMPWLRSYVEDSSFTCNPARLTATLYHRLAARVLRGSAGRTSSARHDRVTKGDGLSLK